MSDLIQICSLVSDEKFSASSKIEGYIFQAIEFQIDAMNQVKSGFFELKVIVNHSF